MLKIKNILPVLAVLVFMSMASAAFAQVSCNVASTPVSRDTSTGLTEPAGDITFACTQTGAGGSSANATITVTYSGIPITNDTTFPTANYGGGGGPAKPIAVSVTGAGCLAATSTTVSNASGSVVILLPAIAPGTGLSCNYSLSGVLLALSGSGATSLVATVSVSPGNNLLITAGQNTPTVVTSVLVPIAASGVTLASGPGLVPTTGTTGTNTPFNTTWSIKATENYIDMFRDVTSFNSGAASNGVQLVYTFAGIPTGSSISGCSSTITTGSVSAPSNTTLTSTVTTTTITVATTPSLTAIDSITLTCTTFNNGTATLPLTAGSVTATVTLAPVGTAFSAAGAVLSNPATTGQIPRYTGPSFGPFTVINIIPLTTHMIFPYVAVGNGFDTGLVIANTTADPYGVGPAGVPALAGARAISGPVTIAFYPAGGGTAFCVSTGAGAATVAGIASCSTVTVGSGLSSGNVNSGSSYVVLASQLFGQVTGAPTAFTGYAFAIANFPFGHPTAFVADATFSGKFASGGPALVLTNPAVVGRSATAQFAAGLNESLGH